MNKLLYLIAAAIIVVWALAFIVYHVRGIIHTLLVIAAVIIIIRLIKGRNIV